MMKKLLTSVIATLFIFILTTKMVVASEIKTGTIESKGEKVTNIKDKIVHDENTELVTESLTDPLINMELVFVKGGCFEMGNNEIDAKPVHEVCVNDFYIGKFEVTQEQWTKIMGKNPSDFNKGDNYPVEQVSWRDVQKFIKKLNQNTSLKYRLPTEAEWEYAARSGGKNERYGGTDEKDMIGNYAWHSGNSREQTHPVGQKKPNGLGIYDMSGNVWEWCSDYYNYDYYEKSPRDNPQGPGRGPARVLRGCSWADSTRVLHVSKRRYYPPTYKYNNLGFRLAMSP
ncbi:MAG: formylglycine-generating enzyme family protein [Candidatus Kuenenia sp.]|nr:formylglycine-generating enzyme family protein [Candidatus Kuenenia hertensis]